MNSLKKRLQSSSASLYEIFTFFTLEDLHRIQSINKKFYSSVLPRLIPKTPIKQENFTYSFKEDDSNLL